MVATSQPCSLLCVRPEHSLLALLLLALLSRTETDGERQKGDGYDPFAKPPAGAPLLAHCGRPGRRLRLIAIRSLRGSAGALVDACFWVVNGPSDGVALRTGQSMCSGRLS